MKSIVMAVFRPEAQFNVISARAH